MAPSGAAVGDADRANRLHAEGMKLCLSARETGDEQQWAAAADCFTEAATLGCAKAQVRIAEMYSQGQGRVAHPQRAVIWWARAALQGDASAQFRLGDCYERGVGVDRDCEPAAVWYAKASAQGVGPATRALAGLYERGEGVAKDHEKAHALFLVATEQEMEEGRKPQHHKPARRGMAKNDAIVQARAAGGGKVGAVGPLTRMSGLEPLVGKCRTSSRGRNLESLSEKEEEGEGDDASSRSSRRARSLSPDSARAPSGKEARSLSPPGMVVTANHVAEPLAEPTGKDAKPSRPEPAWDSAEDNQSPPESMGARSPSFAGRELADAMAEAVEEQREQQAPRPPSSATRRAEDQTRRGHVGRNLRTLSTSSRERELERELDRQRRENEELMMQVIAAEGRAREANARADEASRFEGPKAVENLKKELASVSTRLETNCRRAHEAEERVEELVEQVDMLGKELSAARREAKNSAEIRRRCDTLQEEVEVLTEQLASARCEISVGRKGRNMMHFHTNTMVSRAGEHMGREDNNTPASLRASSFDMAPSCRSPS